MGLISTRVLSPAKAIAFGAALNFTGAMFSSEVARTVGHTVAAPEHLSRLKYRRLQADGDMFSCTRKRPGFPEHGAILPDFYGLVEEARTLCRVFQAGDA
jgi:hypothetical protein